MKQFIFIFSTFFFCSSSFAQKKIVLRKEHKSISIRVNKSPLGVTLKGANYVYANWRAFSSHDSISRVNFWTLDSVKNDYIILRKNKKDRNAYIYDTLSHNKAFQSGWILDTVLEETKTYKPFWRTYKYTGKYVYKKPIDFERIKIPFDSIESFTFSKANNYNSPGLTVLFVPMFIIGSPFAAKDENGKFIWSTFLIGEAIGVSYFFFLRYYIRRADVKTYKLKEWQIKVM